MSSADETPIRISMVIPAYNEAELLPVLLDSIDIAKKRYAGDANAIEVIIGDNNSSDATAAIARSRGCKVAHVEKRAIACARNGGAAIANGEIVCFIDADSRIHPETFNEIDRLMQNPRVIIGATSIVPDRWSLGLLATWLVAIPLSFLMKVDAGVVFCRRADFTAIGGYDESLLFAEDVKIYWDMKRLGAPRGQRFMRASGAKAITSTRKFDQHGHWHYFTVMPRQIWWMLMNKKKMETYARRYWYDVR
jgi:glycosyltransferase involved in cell wall biosynthesis